MASSSRGKVPIASKNCRNFLQVSLLVGGFLQLVSIVGDFLLLEWAVGGFLWQKWAVGDFYLFTSCRNFPTASFNYKRCPSVSSSC